MWVLGKPGALGIKPVSNGHGDVTAVSTGPPPVMPLGIPHPGFGVVVWCALPHRSSFGALPSLLCSSVTRILQESVKAGFFSGSLTWCRAKSLRLTKEHVRISVLTIRITLEPCTRFHCHSLDSPQPSTMEINEGFVFGYLHPATPRFGEFSGVRVILTK